MIQLMKRKPAGMVFPFRPVCVMIKLIRLLFLFEFQHLSDFDNVTVAHAVYSSQSRGGESVRFGDRGKCVSLAYGIGIFLSGGSTIRIALLSLC